MGNNEYINKYIGLAIKFLEKITKYDKRDWDERKQNILCHKIYIDNI